MRQRRFTEVRERVAVREWPCGALLRLNRINYTVIHFKAKRIEESNFMLAITWFFVQEELIEAAASSG